MLDDVRPPAPSETAPVSSADAGGVDTAAVARNRACVVTLGGRSFAVDVRDAREVVMLEPLTAMPGAPAPLIGVANLRGSILGVAEARPLLGLPARPVTSGSPALVLAVGNLEAAMPIDRVVGLDWFDTPLPVDTPDVGPGAAFAAGLIPHAGDYATLLDAGRLLDALRAPWAAVAEA